MLFLLFPFFFFHCSTLLVNRDGTNLIGKSSGFPNPVFREQIQLDVDRSNSKLLPFSLVKLERYGDRFLSKGEGEKNLHLSKSNRVKRRKIRISTVFRESSFVHFSIEYTDISSKLSHEHATKCNFERIAASLRLRRVGTINWNGRRLDAVRALRRRKKRMLPGEIILRCTVKAL